MSNRPSVKSAFEGLRPSIVREPSRTPIAPRDEVALLQVSQEGPPRELPVTQTIAHAPEAVHASTSSFFETSLLKKKKREVLIPVTFRIPQTLRDELSEIAKKHEINQTDLINEGIQLNLQRYR